MSNDPGRDAFAPRSITQTVTWHPIAGPKDCNCGHMHYGRVPVGGGSPTSALAPQWGWCEDPVCTCTSLRTSLPTP